VKVFDKLGRIKTKGVANTYKFHHVHTPHAALDFRYECLVPAHFLRKLLLAQPSIYASLLKLFPEDCVPLRKE
jgi:hypothetical protein